MVGCICVVIIIVIIFVIIKFCYRKTFNLVYEVNKVSFEQPRNDYNQGEVFFNNNYY